MIEKIIYIENIYQPENINIVSILLVKNLVVQIGQIEVNDNIIQVLSLLEAPVVLGGYNHGAGTTLLRELTEVNSGLVTSYKITKI